METNKAPEKRASMVLKTFILEYHVEDKVKVMFNARCDRIGKEPAMMFVLNLNTVYKICPII